MLHEETVETLTNLGLTVLQAKVYIALSRVGTQTGRATAKVAKVAPQDVYRVLGELQEKGLVEKIISKPYRYQAAPVTQGLSMLLRERNEETHRLRRAVSQICRNFANPTNEESNDPSKEFALLPPQEKAINKDKNLFETAQTSLELINSFEESMVLHEYHVKSEMKALKTGIRIREILSVSNSKKEPSGAFLKLITTKPEYQVRYIDYPEPAKLIIKDCKEVLISTKSTVDTLQQPVLWSSNAVLVRIIQQWFASTWEKSSGEYVFLHKT